MTSHRWPLPMQTKQQFQSRWEKPVLSWVNREGGWDSGVPNRWLPQELPPMLAVPTIRRHWGGSAQRRGTVWRVGGGGMLHCTSPQNAMWHKTSGDGSESSREKHIVIYGSGICCQIRNRDLISSKSSSLYKSRWGGVCNAQSCSTLNLLLFLISRSHLQSRRLSWPWCQEPPGGWMGRWECPSTGWVVISILWFGTFRVRREGYGKIQKGDIEKGNKRKCSVQENHRLNRNRFGLEVHWLKLQSSALLFWVTLGKSFHLSGCLFLPNAWIF